MTTYTITEEILAIPAGPYHIDRKDINSVRFVIDAAAAAAGATINGIAFPAGTHFFGAPDAFGLSRDTYRVVVPPVACKVIAIIMKVRKN